MQKISAPVLVILSCFVPGGTVLHAQGPVGAIRGIISDPQGLSVPGAKVEAMHLATNRLFHATANQIGLYTVSNLPIGDYRVVVQVNGFKKSSFEPIHVDAGMTTTVNAQLELGSVAEQVTVKESASPLLETDSAEQSTVVERTVLLDLPLSLNGNRREIESFIGLAPGVHTSFSSTNLAIKSFNGTTNLTSEAIIDGGVFSTASQAGRIDLGAPPYEAIEEFKLANALYPADYGRGFGSVSFTFKSGTNQFHGNGHWLIENNVLDARGFYAASVTPVRQNDFGATLGGPIIKNKTFFFVAYNGFRLTGGVAAGGLITIPTMAFRQGDFSQYPYPIFDPALTQPDGKGGFVREPFVGNIIPPSEISPVAARLMALLPPPDFPNAIVNNFYNRTLAPTNTDVESVKIDHLFNERYRLAYTQWITNTLADKTKALGNNELDPGNHQANHDDIGIRANFDNVISPTTLFHFTFGYSKDAGGGVADSIKGNQLLQIPGIDPSLPGFPTFVVSGIGSNLGNSTAQPSDADQRMYTWSGNFTWSKGRHTLKFGGEFWRMSFRDYQYTDGGSVGGQFTFTNALTSQPDSNSFSTWGFGVASLMLGQVESAQKVAQELTRTYDMNFSAMFLQDKLQVTRRLTVNLGLRYELPTPFSEQHGEFSMVNLSLPNPAAGGLLGAYAFGNAAVVPPIDYFEFAPRVGLAYSLDDKTVIRAGYGLEFAQANSFSTANRSAGNDLEVGFDTNYSVASPNNGITAAMTLNNGYPPFPGPLPNLNPSQQNGMIADYQSRVGGRQPETHNWQLDVQRQLPYAIFLDAAYVGNEGERLPSQLSILNQVPASYLSLGNLLNQSVSSAAAVAAGIHVPFPGFTGSVAQALRPYPQYLDIVDRINPYGHSEYQALQMKAQKRFASGLSFLVSYTFSKVLTNTALSGTGTGNGEPVDTGNRGLSKTLGPVDQPNVLVTSIVYELPGQRLRGIGGAVLRGWELGTIDSYRSGTPLSITGGPVLPIFGGANHPNRILGVAERASYTGAFDPHKDLYLNIAAFSQPSAFAIGNVSPVEATLFGFPSYNEDVSLIKRTYISSVREGFNIEFRAEFFNIFNRVVFSNPASNFNVPNTFGVVSAQGNTPRIIQFGLKVNF